MWAGGTSQALSGGLRIGCRAVQGSAFAVTLSIRYSETGRPSIGCPRNNGAKAHVNEGLSYCYVLQYIFCASPQRGLSLATTQQAIVNS